MLSDLCQTNTSLILIKSNDPKMNKLNQLNGFYRSDLRFDISKSKSEVITDLKKRQLASEAEKLDILKIQSILMRALKAALTSKDLVSWSDHVSLITPAISIFARKALIRCLATNSNLYRWGRSETDACPHCKQVETENHVLNNCSISALQDRYTWRHNAVLKQLVEKIQSALCRTDEMFVGLPGHKNPSTVFNGMRPDINAIHNGRVSILELTCCYEKIFEASKSYKVDKYKN